MKKFRIYLRERAPDIINFEKKSMLLLKELKSHQDETECDICRQILHKILLKIKINQELETIVILLVNTEVHHIVFVT